MAGLYLAVLLVAFKDATAYPALFVDDTAVLGQRTSLRCICDGAITLKEPTGMTALHCKSSTSGCLNNNEDHIFLDRNKSEGETYVAVIKETRAQDEGKWRCQCGDKEATATLRIQRKASTGPQAPSESKNATAYPALFVDDTAVLGQRTSLRCICDGAITLKEPKGTTALHCKSSTSGCLNNNEDHIFLDRNKSEGETYVAVIKETRAQDEGEWRCQCGDKEATATLRVHGSPHPFTDSNSSFCIYPCFRLLMFLLLLVYLT
ncbi:obscurin-like [Haliotis cracherodii]|uniref:obscurin-like n=1 Tax=Haliotis cracherodii TaxID=6455 RepID=UPI0039EA4907